ncbi:MAG: hypothetical protein AAFW65_06905, partial [Pseudomonadota bacterium]
AGQRENLRRAGTACAEPSHSFFQRGVTSSPHGLFISTGRELAGRTHAHAPPSRVTLDREAV